jgi:carboxyl-terminal processing protease
MKLLRLLALVLAAQTFNLASDSSSSKKTEITTVFNEKEHEASMNRWLNTTAEVVALLEKKSFRKIDFSNFMQTMLKAGVASVDAHSAFIPNFEEAAEATAGKFSGIGISIISKPNEDDHLLVVDVLDDSPAQKSGLVAGDKIVEVAGEKLRGLSSDEVISRIKGPIGSKVKLKILRDKKPHEYEVRRDTIKEQSSYCYHFKDQNIYYFSLKMFTEVAPQQMKNLLETANSGACKGIILDLRSNPGGVLDAAVDMASLFLPRGSSVVMTKDAQNVITGQFATKTEPVLKSSLPIVILVNNFTASASEILAGALRYYSSKETAGNKLSVFIVGTTSFGKGSVQEVIPISNGCALKQTSMLYFLPDGTSIQARGVDPDFLVKPKTIPEMELKWIDEFYGKETSLKHHVTPDEIAKVEKGKFPGFAHEIDQITTKKQEEATAKREKENDKDGKKEFDKKETTKKRAEDIALNVQIQAAVNLISILDLGRKAYPEEVSTRNKALTFLKKHLLCDTPAAVVRVE